MLDIVFRSRNEAIYKVIVVGDSFVGKTKLLSKYATYQFEEKYLSTVGVCILKELIELEDKDFTVNLMFWDIANQSQFHELYRSYFNGADGMLLVFDISRLSTFNNVNYWYSIAMRYGLSGIPRILIGNKVNPGDVRKIPISMAVNLSKKLNALYFETSVLTGVNLKLIFHKIADLIYSSKEKFR